MSVEVIEDAAAGAPSAPGVYFFLDVDDVIVYIGKAGDLRRRLRDHARQARRAASPRDVARARVVSDIRWERSPDEDAAAAREADLIVAFGPMLNASIAAEGRWVYVVTTPRHEERELDLTLATASAPSVAPGSAAGSRAYGCFAHLGVGVSSRPAIACSEGYTALLRLVWAACEHDRSAAFPHLIARPSPPGSVVLPFDPHLAGGLHRFLSGTSSRVVDELWTLAAERRPPVHHPALRRDLDGARGCFRAGPAAVRSLRLRHGLPPGPLARDAIEGLLLAEVRAAIGPCSIGPRDDPTGGILGERMARHVAVRMSARRR